MLGDSAMPGAEWFPGATLNYAQHVLRHGEDPQNADTPAILHVDESSPELPPPETTPAN